MKKGFLTLMGIALLIVFNKAAAQCTVQNLTVNVNSIISGANGCTVTFDLSWEQDINSGNKFAYVHLWNATSYHTPAASWPSGGSAVYSGPSRAPGSVALQNTVANFVIENNNSSTPSLGTTYYPASGVTVYTAGATIIKSSAASVNFERLTIRNISLTFASCAGAIALRGDIWASQASNGNNVHCASQNLAVSLNDPRVNGFKTCGMPRAYSITIATTSTTALNLFYNLYADDGDGIFEPGAGDALRDTKTNISASAASPYTAANVSYPGNTNSGERSGLWVEVKHTANPTAYATVELFENTCAPLPVIFESFSASKTPAGVLLNWATTEELNNAGFYVERKTGGEPWRSLAFVAAKSGTTTARQTYQFTDAASVRGLVQYRLQQVDLDGKARYSDVRAVKSEGGAAALTLFPNPAPGGRFSVVVNDDAVYTIQVMDAAGRVVKQLTQVRATQTVSDLKPGTYLVTAEEKLSGSRTTQRIIVQ